MRILFIVLLSFAPALVQATVLRLSELPGESVLVEVRRAGAGPRCNAAQAGPLFRGDPKMTRLSADRYVQSLDSEVGDDAVYLKAARMGQGIYVHLPYFVPVAAGCAHAHFDIVARHILWDGQWHAGRLRIASSDARGKSVFFTNEPAPYRSGARYFDSAIPLPTLQRLDRSFDTIVRFYRDALASEPMRGVGSVVALARNGGNYFGFGGDSLNIIRMSFDNPRPEHFSSFEQVFPATFAHELAHKLQSERLFALPFGRQIVEGSADFLKIVVLFNSGLIDQHDARQRVRKAIAHCGAFAGELSFADRAEQRLLNYRESYDCGMVYYFVAYYSSGMQDSEFIATLLRSLTGEKQYGGEAGACLQFERACANARLRDLLGAKERYLTQAAWLEAQLASRPLPHIGSGPPGE